MYKTTDICEEISKSPELMFRFNQTQSFDELYSLCKEINPNITETEIEEKIKKLISQTASSNKVELSDSDLEMVAGGVMDFNKWKASALTALVVLGAVTATSAVSQTYAYAASPQSVTTSANKSLSNKEQQLLNSDLHTAVKKGDKSNCEELLNLGANIDARGESGQSPLEYSVFLGNVDMVKFFLEKCADINFKNNDKETPLMYCVPSTSYSELAVSGNAEIIAELLLENGAKVNEKTYKGDTALEKAVLKGYTELAKLFHKYGATTDGKNDKGQTKMFENLNPRKDLPRGAGTIPKAMMENNQKITKLFLELGADANTKDAKGVTALIYATENSNYEAVKLLLEFGADVNAQDNEGRTVLMHASKLNKTEIIKALLAKGADINKRDAKGQTAAMSAIRYEPEKPGGGSIPFHNISVEALKLLIENGADLNLKDNLGETVLTYTAKRRYDRRYITKSNNYSSRYDLAYNSFYESTPDETLKLLIEKGADVNIKDGQARSFLQLAVGACVPSDIIGTIIRKGADVNAKDNEGNTVLHVSAKLLWEKYLKECSSLYSTPGEADKVKKEVRFFMEANSKNTELLLKSGANINARNNIGETALIQAAQRKSPEVAKILLEKNADINIKSSDGKTALMQACASGDSDMVNILLNKNADVNLKDNEGRTALIHSAIWGGNYANIKMLLDKNADVTIKDNKGRTVLMYTVNHAHGVNKDIVKLLTEKKSDTAFKDQSGQNALVSAFKRGADSDILQTLLDKATDVNVTDENGKTALMYAAAYSTGEMEKLIQKGADVNVKSAEGETALMIASYNRNFKGVEILLRNKADVNTKNNHGSTALMRSFNKDISKVLLDNGADVNVKDNIGKTALDHIIEEGHNQDTEQRILEIAKLLLEDSKIVIDTKSENINNLFFSSVQNNDTSLIKILADKGIDINSKNKKGRTALSTAVELAGSNYRFAYSIRVLLEKGSDVNAQDDNGNTALIHAVKNKSDHSLELVELLIAKGADSSIKNKEGKIASDYNDVRRTQIQKLLEKA